MRAAGSLALAVLLAVSPSARAADWQSAAERALGKRAGCVVVLDPADGRLLAVVHPRLAAHLAVAPGSVAKLVTVMAALQKGVATSTERFECRGERSVWPCWHQHEHVDLERALARSCSAAVGQIGQELGASRLVEAFGQAGWGRSTESDLADEVAGHLEVPQGRRETVALAIGDSSRLAVTPLQVAVLVAAIANGGTRYRPHRAPAPPRILSLLPWPRGLAVVRAGMRRAVVEGTATSAAVPGLAVFGKTGTVLDPDDAARRMGWFAGYGAGWALVVFVRDGTGFGAAAPVAGRLLRALAS